MLGCVLEQDVNPLLLDGLDQQERMVRANQDLQFAELIGGWWYPAEHEIRIGGRRGGVKLVRFDRREGDSTLGRMATLGEKLVDKRIVERNMAKGLITKEEYEKHLADLDDREGSYDTVEIEPEGSEDPFQAE